MSYIAGSYSGIEDVVIDDVKELTGNKAKKVKIGRVEFDYKDINAFLQKVRSVSFVYELVGSFKFKDLNELARKSSKLDYSFIRKDFVVRCRREGQHDFSRIDVEQAVGEIIFKKEHVVNLKSNNIIVADIIDNDCFIGKLIKEDMHKRDYRVKINKQGLNSCVAYSLLKIAGWKKENSLLDPNCRDGVILIEAGLIGGKKIYGMEISKQNFISAGMNAQLAKTDVKLYDKEIFHMRELFKDVDYVITYLPAESNSVSKNFVNRLYGEFFGNVKSIVKKRTVVLILDDSLLKDYLQHFKIVERREIIAGNKYIVYVLE